MRSLTIRWAGDSDVNTREGHFGSCLSRSVVAAGGAVSDAPGVFSVGPSRSGAAVDLPIVQDRTLSLLAGIRRAWFFSEEVRKASGVSGFSALPPIDRSLVESANWSAAKWINQGQSGIRLYSVVPEGETPALQQMISAYIDEYRITDPVSLTVRITGHASETELAIDLVRSQSRVPPRKHPRIFTHAGSWNPREIGCLHSWGDVCLLPWSGCGDPLDAMYAMAAGNYVIATGWFAGQAVTPRLGTSLRYTLLNQEANADWGHFRASLRIAVAAGKRLLYPAMKEMRQYDVSVDVPKFWDELTALAAGIDD